MHQSTWHSILGQVNLQRAVVIYTQKYCTDDTKLCVFQNQETKPSVGKYLEKYSPFIHHQNFMKLYKR